MPRTTSLRISSFRTRKRCSGWRRRGLSCRNVGDPYRLTVWAPSTVTAWTRRCLEWGDFALLHHPKQGAGGSRRYGSTGTQLLQAWGSAQSVAVSSSRCVGDDRTLIFSLKRDLINCVMLITDAFARLLRKLGLRCARLARLQSIVACVRRTWSTCVNLRCR